MHDDRKDSLSLQSIDNGIWLSPQVIVYTFIPKGYTADQANKHRQAFADALIEAGLPQGDVPLALLAFNLGVEAGQLMFIGGVLAAGLLFARLGGGALIAREGKLLRTTAYGIGTLSSFWMFERVARFWV